MPIAIETAEDTGPSAATDAALAARLRRIHVIAAVAAALGLVAAAACTLALSDRFVARNLTQAAENAKRDAKALSGVVDRMFHELAAIPQVLSGNQELREIIERYNSRGEAFAGLPQETRRSELKK